MPVLIAIALKSLLIAGLCLGLLQLMKQRSAAERSWVAHVGLVALVVLAIAPLALPRWRVETPALYGKAVETGAPVPAARQTPAAIPAAAHVVRITPPANAALPPPRVSINAATAATAAYALPALALLLLTFVALLRLVALRARADVLVDGHWLSALARAQRRMGFKHGTALLTSDELASPVSWGLMRPVILLNSRAVEAVGEAEAIIAHELAHVARMDWVKLLLARVATALFWFNPLVWVLAREAHQLREEAADDSVLASDIPDTDYAQLLVGVARHECPGLLLGAHGVAPSKGSLARRVARVLDGKLMRGPVPRSFGLTILAGALLVATPLAALTFSPPAPKTPKPSSAAASSRLAAPVAEAAAAEVPADLPRIIARGVSASVAAASAAIAAAPPRQPAQRDYRLTSSNGSTVAASGGTVVARNSSGATITMYAPDAQGRRRVVMVAPDGATAISYADANAGADARTVRVSRHGESAIQVAFEMKALGLTPEYIDSFRSASPALRGADTDDVVAMRSVGVTPDYIRELARSGYGNLDADDLEQARSMGVTPAYVREIVATGVRPDIDELIQLRAMNIRPDELARLRGSGRITRTKLKEVLKSRAPAPPVPPQPPSDPGDG
jgi:bla regulator protein blaR1